jgi:hypothetical protein
MKRARFTLMAATMTASTIVLSAQDASQSGQLNEHGNIVVDGRSVAYVIHRLPVNAFPQLPGPIAQQLEELGCMIPQTFEAHQPENVVHGSLEAAGTDDWAVLCSVKGTVSLLVFFAGSPERPMTLSTAKETQRLQDHGAREPLGFNWGIDRATPALVHDAQIGMMPRPVRPDHDALSDSVIEHRTICHFYSKGDWTLLDMPN